MSELNENEFPPLEPQPFVTEEGREIERLRAELAAAIKQRDEAVDIGARTMAQLDEAHSLILAWWRKNAVNIVDDGESMYALMPMGNRAMMNNADKRAFLAATAAWR